MFKNKVDTYLRRAGYKDEHCWTPDKPMASLSICHLGLWLGWQILLNLVKSQDTYRSVVVAILCGGLYMLDHARAEQLIQQALFEVWFH